MVPQNRPLTGWRLLVVVGLLFGAGAITSSCGGSTGCDRTDAPPEAAFIGTLRAKHGDVATFEVERWTISTRRDTTVDVHYPSARIRFLHVGRRYDVNSWSTGEPLASDMHNADDPCSRGTAYADGSSIDTSLWSRSLVRRAIVSFVVVLVGLLVLIAWLTRRARRHREVPAD